MAVAPSFQDELDVGEAELKSRRPDLLVAEGDIALAQLHSSAAMHDMVTQFAARGIRSTFLDGSADDELAALVDDRYNIQKQEATSAQVTARFARPSAGGGEPAGTISAGTTIATAIAEDGSQIQFVTDVDLPFGVGDLGPNDVAATAIEAGRDGNVLANTIIRIIDVPGFDSSFTVNNPAAAGGGNDDESDEELRERARSFWLTLRRGTLGAIEYGALQVATVRVATASQDADGLVTLVVSDADGNSTAQMITDVETEIENWKCAGAIVTTIGGTQVLVAVTVTLVAVSAGFSVSEAAAGIQNAIEARINRLQAEKTLYLDTIIATVIATAPDDIDDVTITLPASDVVPTAGQVLRAGTVLVS